MCHDYVFAVIPAKCGGAFQQREALVIHFLPSKQNWIPAFAGMTKR